MSRWIRVGSALFAGVAAGFWFASAWGELPQIVPYWDHTPSDDPFFQALAHAAMMNRWAAIFSGCSALLWFAAEITGRL
jgi:hypothetical protein